MKIKRKKLTKEEKEKVRNEIAELKIDDEELEDG